MSSSSQQQQNAPDPLLAIVVLLVFTLLFAWPAMLVGLFLGWCGKLWQFPRFVWFLLAGLGVLGLWLVWTQMGVLHVLQTLLHAIPPFTTWNHWETWRVFLPLLFPFWLRSLCLIPLASLTVHLFPKRMEEQLLSKERDRLARQEAASRRAIHALRKVPDAVKGKAVIGIRIH
ncbi:MAG TPA: hypothetical protein VFN35_22855 [Ktedonobacteraceae bacterium]|nr:hypothetical protein [Ktedonobacteraceae bacterium]